MKKRFAFLLISLIVLLSISISAQSELHDIGFTGQRYDSSIDLVHFPYRTYDSQAGRFLQRDPSGFIDGVNIYEYVSSNALGSTDSLGLQRSLIFRPLNPTTKPLFPKGGSSFLEGGFPIDAKFAGQGAGGTPNKIKVSQELVQLTISSPRANQNLVPLTISALREVKAGGANARMHNIMQKLEDVGKVKRVVQKPKIKPIKPKKIKPKIPTLEYPLPQLVPGRRYSATELTKIYAPYAGHIAAKLQKVEGKSSVMIRHVLGDQVENYVDYCRASFCKTIQRWTRGQGQKKRVVKSPDEFNLDWISNSVLDAKAISRTGINSPIVARRVLSITRDRYFHNNPNKLPPKRILENIKNQYQSAANRLGLTEEEFYDWIINNK